MGDVKVISRRRCPGAGRLRDDELVFARMEIARRRGVGIYLSPETLDTLFNTHLGEVMSGCADDALKSPSHPTTDPSSAGA